MYILKKLNVEKQTDSKEEMSALLAAGYRLLDEEEAQEPEADGQKEDSETPTEKKQAGKK